MIKDDILGLFKKIARYESLTPRHFQRILVFISVITLNAVTTAVHANITVVWKSNNIIFTLKILLTTNLMNNYEKQTVISRLRVQR